MTRAAATQDDVMTARNEPQRAQGEEGQQQQQQQQQHQQSHGVTTTTAAASNGTSTIISNGTGNTAPPPTTTRPPLSAIAPKLVLGGAGFSNQLHPDPVSLPSRAIVQRALDLGLRAIDTSPYYGPSEVILGDALAQPGLRARHPRESFLLMTKVGRVAADRFDYSPAWVRQSVERSLQRFGTAYLDVVFAHDVEFVAVGEAAAAVGALMELVREGKVRYVGISGYPLERLAAVARAVRERCGRPVDAVQVWGQLTLQNTRLLQEDGLRALKDAGVDCVFASSPLAIGLLRAGGVPVGELGDWHPAPKGLREAAKRASDLVEARGTTLAELALKYAVAQGLVAGEAVGVPLNTIMGGGSMSEIEENWAVGNSVASRFEAKGNAKNEAGGEGLSALLPENEMELVKSVQEILGEWLDYSLGN